MPNYDDDAQYRGPVFEDPRFANGRHPNDDEPGFGDAPAGRRSGCGCGCFLPLLALGAALAVVCCGGLGWLEVHGRGERIERALADAPAWQGGLSERLGPDYALRLDPAATFEAGGNAAVFEATGRRGPGRLTVRTRRDGDALTLVRGTLAMRNGEVFPFPPEQAKGEPGTDEPAKGEPLKIRPNSM